MEHQHRFLEYSPREELFNRRARLRNDLAQLPEGTVEFLLVFMGTSDIELSILALYEQVRGSPNAMNLIHALDKMVWPEVNRNYMDGELGYLICREIQSFHAVEPRLPSLAVLIVMRCAPTLVDGLWPNGWIETAEEWEALGKPMISILLTGMVCANPNFWRRVSREDRLTLYENLTDEIKVQPQVQAAFLEVMPDRRVWVAQQVLGAL